jgi:hypothetical protein
MGEITINENGEVLTETIEGITIPENYSFSCINDFVHRHDTHYEELQALCLGMACEIERLSNKK